MIPTIPVLSIKTAPECSDLIFRPPKIPEFLTLELSASKISPPKIITEMSEEIPKNPTVLESSSEIEDLSEVSEKKPEADFPLYFLDEAYVPKASVENSLIFIIFSKFLPKIPIFQLCPKRHPTHYQNFLILNLDHFWQMLPIRNYIFSTRIKIVHIFQNHFLQN